MAIPSTNDFETGPLYLAIHAYVQEYMKQYDASHDFNHIKRVLALSKHIARAEQALSPPSGPAAQGPYEMRAVILAALLHDVGDKKYLRPGEGAEGIIPDLLRLHSCPEDLVEKVSVMVKHVSYSTEIADPEAVKRVLERFPELGAVQDADRLDAIGAVGIGRVFAFGAVKVPDRGMEGSIAHFGDKLERLEGLMKTNEGKRLAVERTRRLKVFKEWWEEEQGFLD